MKGSITVIVLVILGLVVACGMLAYIFLIKPQTSTSSSSVGASSAQNIPVKDFAPNLPMSQKTTITIQTSDSSDIKYIVPTNQVDTYVKQLPPGYQVVSKTP